MNEEPVTTLEVFEEVRKYSPSQRRELIEEFETDIQNLARSMENLYDEHAGVFMMYGVQIEVKFYVFNEVAFRQVLGCPEFYNQVSAMAKGLKEAAEMVKGLKEVFDDQRAQTSD